MRRIAQTLTVAAAIAGMCLTAAPASVSANTAGRAAGSACGTRGYATRWYRDARTKARARLVLVKAATVTPGIDARLPRG